VKTVLRTGSIAGLLLLLVSWVGAQSTPDRPPNVPQENWIPLSDSVGVVIVNVNSTPSRTVYRFGANEPKVQSGTGVLMAKYNGVWTRVDLAPPRAEGQPLGL
jgi:hypothetical protein